MKNDRRNTAVSEVVGIIVLLFLTVGLFSTLCFGVISYPSNPSLPSVNLIGTIKGDNFILEHHGGESLNIDTEIIITIDDNQGIMLVASDENYLSNDAKKDNLWGIGEGFVYHNVDFLVAENVGFTVVDVDSDSVMMIGKL